MRISLGIALVLLCGCQQWSPGTNDTSDRNAAKPSFGALVYSIAVNNTQQAGGACLDTRMAAWADEKERFITAIDNTVPPNLLIRLPDLVREGVIPGVSNGSLPLLTDQVADALNTLATPPHRKTLDAGLRLVNGPTVAASSQASELFRRILAVPDLNQTLRDTLAWASLPGQQNTAPIATLSSLAEELFAWLSEPGTCPASPPVAIANTWLRTMNETFETEPAWSVWPDLHANPRVHINPETRTLFEPFMDRDLDGAADVDNLNYPINAQGQRIAVRTFIAPRAINDPGLVCTDNGDQIFDYFDTRRTVLAAAFELLGEGLHSGMLPDLLTMLDLIQKNDPAWKALRDMAHAGLETTQWERLPALVQTIDHLLQNDLESAKELLHSLSTLLHDLQGTSIDLFDPALANLAPILVEQVTTIFATPTEGASLPALLWETVRSDLPRADRFVHALRLSVSNRWIAKSNTCGGDDVDEQASLPVNWNKARFYTNNTGTRIDNRSVLEQTVDLLIATDCGSVFGSGDSLAGFIIRQLVDGSADDACNLVDTSLSLLGIPILGDFFGGFALGAIGCDADEVWPHLEALDLLAKSGALEMYLPMAKVFVDHGELDTLLRILHKVGEDLKRGDRGALRRFFPVLQSVLESPASVSVIHTASRLTETPSADGHGDLGDLAMGMIANALKSPQKPVLTMARGLQAFVGDGTGVHLQAIKNFGNTHIHLGDGDALDDPRLLHVMRTLFANASALSRTSSTTFLCEMQSLQSHSDRFLNSDVPPRLIALGRSLYADPAMVRAATFVEAALQPTLHEQWPDIAAPLLQNATSLMQTPFTSDEMRAGAHFASEALGDIDTTGVLTALRALVEHDTEGMFFDLLGNGLRLQPNGSTAFGDVTDVMARVLAIREEDNCHVDAVRHWTNDEARALITRAAHYMQDDHNGLGAIYTLIRVTQPGTNQ